MNLDYIVTGTGRCGTLFVANFLTSSGIACSHEAVFTTKGLDFALDVLSGREKLINSIISEGSNLSDGETEVKADASFMAAPFLAHFLDSKVIHVVRSPAKVVNSFLNMRFFHSDSKVSYEQNPYEHFMRCAIPELDDCMPHLDRACLYWVAWNEMIESSGRVSFVHRIEDSKANLSAFIGGPKCSYFQKCNSRMNEFKWSIGQIDSPKIRIKLKDMAKKYGYFRL